MDNVTLTIILGMVMVPVVSFLKRDHWSNRVNFAIAAVLAALIGAGNVVLTNHVTTLHQFVQLWGTALAASQVAYHMYFSGTKWETTLAGIGSNTAAVDTTPDTRSAA